MKKVGVLILGIIIVLQVTVAPSFAQNLFLQATESAVATPPARIQYDLPYPGILPDNPLYFLKVLRDRTVGLLINDPVKKAEFNLLQSDKKLFASQILFEKEKEQLAIDTLSKSNNYMHQAVSEAKKAKSSGKDAGGIGSTIKTAIGKHEEVVENLLKTNKSSRKQIQGELSRLKEIEQFYIASFPH